MVHVIQIALGAERRVRQLYPEISSHSFFLVKQTKFYTFPEDLRKSHTYLNLSVLLVTLDPSTSGVNVTKQIKFCFWIFISLLS